MKSNFGANAPGLRSELTDRDGKVDLAERVAPGGKVPANTNQHVVLVLVEPGRSHPMGVGWAHAVIVKIGSVKAQSDLKVLGSGLGPLPTSVPRSAWY
jgi:hypothetical protein